jgi:hypothetical protein
VALVLELESAAAARGAAVGARIGGWRLGRAEVGGVEPAVAGLVRAAFRSAGRPASTADHVLLPARSRDAAARGAAAARGEEAPPAAWIDLARGAGNPAGAAALLQIAASTALISAGRLGGPGLAISAGAEGTLSVVVVTAAGSGAA